MYSVGGTTCLASLMMLFCQLWGHQQGAALLWCFAPLTLVHLWVVTQRWGCLLSAPLQLALGSLFLPLFTEEGHLLAPKAPLLCLFSNNMTLIGLFQLVARMLGCETFAALFYWKYECPPPPMSVHLLLSLLKAASIPSSQTMGSFRLTIITVFGEGGPTYYVCL